MGSRRLIESSKFAILDVLTTDGGWLLAEQIREMLPQYLPDTLKTALYRMAKIGFVEGRERPNYFEWRGEKEWKATEAGRAWFDNVLDRELELTS